MHANFIYYIVLLLIISFLVMFAQRIRIAFPIVLVVGGLMMSFIPGLPTLEIDPELIFLIFLPPLLYEAAWQTSWKDFWKWRRVIASFAFLIVLVTSCLVAVVSYSIIPGFTLALGFLLGGIVSPPDAVSATSIMKEIKVPKRLSSIIEGESLLNDASSIVVFRFALAAVMTGQFVFKAAAANFFIVIVMGIITGLVVALLFYAIHRWLPTTPSIDIVLTFVTPYVMYIVAEQFHFSGVLSVVSGGLFLSARQDTMLNYQSRIQGLNVWSVAAFVLNGTIFLLIGLQLPVIVRQLGDEGLAGAITYGLIITGTLIIGRLLCTLGAAQFTRFISRFITTADSNPGWRGPLVFGWAGMRGVVSLAAALSIPLYLPNQQPFPQRNLILFITFTVILVTLVFQGLTLPWLIRKMKLKEVDYPMPLEEQDRLVEKKLKLAANKLLDEYYARHGKHNELLFLLRQRFDGDLRVLDYITQNNTDDGKIAEYRSVVNDIIREQRLLLQKINKKAEVSQEVVKRHLLQLDHDEARLHQQLAGT
ncbi:MAG TPA: Na+/H+ antiporter [Chitinophagaceae bacterium]|nr:Na+/H+ antiporter [Chitinophagaceae bacterium]